MRKKSRVGRETLRSEQQKASDRAHTATAVQIVYGENTVVSQMASSLEDASANYPPLAYSCVADVAAERMIEMEIKDRIRELAAREDINGIGLVFELASSTPLGISGTNLSAARKTQKKIVKARLHCISRIIFAGFPTAEGLVIKPTFATLIVRPSDPQGRYTPSLPLSGEHLPTSRWFEDPDSGVINRVCSAFSDASWLIRRAVDRAMREQSSDAWLANRSDRALALWQADVLTPSKKTFSANGLGIEILSHALTGPELRAKEAKRRSAKTREDVVDTLWREPIERNLAAPPFIRL